MANDAARDTPTEMNVNRWVLLTYGLPLTMLVFSVTAAAVFLSTPLLQLGAVCCAVVLGCLGVKYVLGQDSELRPGQD